MSLEILPLRGWWRMRLLGSRTYGKRSRRSGSTHTLVTFRTPAILLTTTSLPAKAPHKAIALSTLLPTLVLPAKVSRPYCRSAKVSLPLCRRCHPAHLLGPLAPDSEAWIIFFPSSRQSDIARTSFSGKESNSKVREILKRSCFVAQGGTDEHADEEAKA